MNKILCIVTIFLLVHGYRTADSGDSSTSIDDTFCDGTGWVQYRDERCFKLIKKWTTREEAKYICAQDSSSQLVSIKTPDEQKYLTEFLFETSQVNFNVWIGAKRLSDNLFGWDDCSRIDFTNWDQTYPTEDARRGCVVMQSELMKNAVNIQGKWRDVICDSVNYVVCQKLPKWSFAKLQQTLLEQRNKQIATENDLAATKDRLTNVESNPVPIGFIYVQLSSQPEPRALWPAVQWKDVTSEYAGLFFRAEGDGSAQFGTVQAENAPRLIEVRLNPILAMPNQGNGWKNTTLNVGEWSTGVGVFAGSFDGIKGHTHQFFQSSGKIRPRNMAMRFWKRILLDF